MLRLLGILIKITLFSAVILILGNVVRWQGRTVSDHLKTRMAQVEHRFARMEKPEFPKPERALKHAKDWAGEKMHEAQRTKSATPRAVNMPRDQEDDLIPNSERQKLRALIRDLNGSHGNE